MMNMRLWVAAVLMLSTPTAVVAAADPADARDPRCQPTVLQPDRSIRWGEGLTIVTEIASRAGRYQSLKKIVSFSVSAGIRISYTDNSTISPTTRPIYRFISTKDLSDAEIYDQSFNGGEFRQGATALGPSRSVLRTLKQSGSVKLSMHSLTGDTRIPGQFVLLEPQAVDLPVIINDKETNLAALHVRASFGDVSGEFWLLDDLEAPLALMYHLEASPPNWQDLRVVEITVPPRVPERSIQEMLAEGGCIEMHDIHFDFDKDNLRPEAEPILAAIADVLSKKPTWHLTIAGHTDSSGSEQHNLELSRRGWIKHVPHLNAPDRGQFSMRRSACTKARTPAAHHQTGLAFYAWQRPVSFARRWRPDTLHSPLRSRDLGNVRSVPSTPRSN